ncbi:MAG: LysR substrate-binding domain-containing protein [Promethearchaeota archaeon]
MRFHFIRNFVKLTQYKNFSTLSNDLSISQSTLSNQISQLEKELGDIKLIDRTTRTFKLTEQGEIFLKTAKEMVTIMDKCLLDLSQYSKDQHEQIIISASTLPGSHILPSFIARFKEDHPNAHFKIIINNSQKSIDMLRKNNAHFAGIGSFMGFTENEFDIVNIGTDALVFICSPNHELVKGGNKEVKFEDLIKCPFISREKGSGTRNVFEQEFSNFYLLNVQLEINDNDSIISAVSDSNYISILSEIIAKKAENAGLIKILRIKEHPIIAERNIFLVKLKGKELSMLKKSFWKNISNKK